MKLLAADNHHAVENGATKLLGSTSSDSGHLNVGRVELGELLVDNFRDVDGTLLALASRSTNVRPARDADGSGTRFHNRRDCLLDLLDLLGLYAELSLGVASDVETLCLLAGRVCRHDALGRCGALTECVGGHQGHRVGRARRQR